MYDIKINNKNFIKILEKYNNNNIKNFIIISKIKKYKIIKNKINDYTKKYKNNLEKEIKEITNNIIKLEKEIDFENKIKNNLLKNNNHLQRIYFDINHLQNSIKLFTYDESIKLITKKFISELYFYNFFKNEITIKEIKSYKIKYNNYLLDKLKNNNNFKKTNKKESINYQNKIVEIKNKIYDIRKNKYELYKKNNLISKNVIIEYDKYYAFDNKEIYSLKQKVIELTKKLKEVNNNKINNKLDNKFNLINLKKKNIVLPIIRNNNTLLLNYNLKNMFIKKLNNEIQKCNEYIKNKEEMIKKLLLEKNNKKGLLEYKIIDKKLVYFYNNIQEDLNNLEKEIIKDYLFLNKK